MKKDRRLVVPYRLILVAFASTVVFSCSNLRHSSPIITVLGTMKQLEQGNYDGSKESAALLRCGDTGLGTFDRLDGEMVVTDGQVWQVKADGTIRRAEDQRALFAGITDFSSNKSIDLRTSTPRAALENQLNGMFSADEALAFKVSGEFSLMRTRSVPPQNEPYPPLAQVITQQTVFDNDNVHGEIVGYRTPASAADLTGSGYHYHFLSKDRTIGGHVLDFTLASGTAEISLINAIEPLPQ